MYIFRNFIVLILGYSHPLVKYGVDGISRLYISAMNKYIRENRVFVLLISFKGLSTWSIDERDRFSMNL